MVPVAEAHIQAHIDEGFQPDSGRRGVVLRMARAWDQEFEFHRSYRSIDAMWVGTWFIRTTKGMLPSSRRQYGSWIRTFLQWGVDQGLFDRSVVLFKTGRTSSKRGKPPLYLTREQILSIWENQTWYWRGLVAFTTMTMLRGSEIITARVGDIDMAAGMMTANRWKTEDFTDHMPMVEDLIDEMELYLEAYEKSIGEPLTESMMLFPRYRSGQGGTPRKPWIKVYPHEQRDNLWQPMKRLILEVLPEEIRNDPEKTRGIGGHALRRSWSQIVYEVYIADPEVHDAVAAVQGQLGHSKRATTELYIGKDPVREGRDKAMRGRRFFPPKPKAKVLRFPTAEDRNPQAGSAGTGSATQAGCGGSELPATTAG